MLPSETHDENLGVLGVVRRGLGVEAGTEEALAAETGRRSLQDLSQFADPSCVHVEALN